MRALRREVSATERRKATRAFARIAGASLLLQAGRRIAVYHAVGHEADMSAVIDLALERGCQLYLPRVTDHRRNLMQFVPFTAGSSLRRNAFGIFEPTQIATPVRVRDLDIVFMPLVAFDARGWRIGSGAGFYDRKLHHLHIDRRWRRPRLIGIAYDFQRVPRLARHRWDIPLDAVITERGLHRSHRHEEGENA